MKSFNALKVDNSISICGKSQRHFRVGEIIIQKLRVAKILNDITWWWRRVHWHIADHRDYLCDLTTVWLFNDKLTNTNWFLMNESHVIVIIQLRAYKNLHFIAHFKCYIAKFSNYWFCVQCNMDLTFFYLFFLKKSLM